MTSGPVEAADVVRSAGRVPRAARSGPALEVTESRTAAVGAARVRRALPTRGRRTVGAWCFVDHAGPMRFDAGERPDVGPHPHMGLHTVTWLMEGELLHRDSLGTEQVLRPGQLNLMTAGHGIAHAEEAHAGSRAHLVQIWVAQPSATRDAAPAFEHHPELPRVELDGAVATVLAGACNGAVSPARRDSEIVGVDLDVRTGSAVVPLDPAFEHALVVTAGEVSVGGQVTGPGHLVYLGDRRDELEIRALAPARVLLLGGVPFPEPLFMWWNLVARSRPEIDTAYLDWADDSGRFGRVASPLERAAPEPPPWMPARR